MTINSSESTKRYSKMAEKHNELEYKERFQFIHFTLNQIRQGKLLYFLYLFIDIICLIISNHFAYDLYMRRFSKIEYGYSTHAVSVMLMIIIDILVTFVFNTLNRVPRRRKRKEIFIGAFHVFFSFTFLATVLFSIKRADEYSRIIIYAAYILYFVLFVSSHVLIGRILRHYHKKSRDKVLLLTSDRFVQEGIKDIRNLGMEVDYVFLMKNNDDYKLDEKDSQNVKILSNIDDAIDIVCWDWVDKLYIYGIESNTIPWKLQRVCWEMRLMLHMVEFKYKVIDLKTIRDENPKYGALSFLERKDDIPFTIRRVFWITETEAPLHRGYHAHKKNCQLLFCPYGKIDIVLDDGENKTTVTLDKPSKGLIIMPCMWHEMIWREDGSILCVLASEYYDPDDYIRKYEDFKEYWLVNKKREYVL